MIEIINILKYILIFSSLYYIYLFYYFTYSKKILSFHINIYSCNRPYYLKRTLSSILNYLYVYERDIKYYVNLYDQGTYIRDNIVDAFLLDNIFYLNPSGYAYSFQLSFTYKPTQFVLILEEDWIIDTNVFYYLKYKQFISFYLNIFIDNYFIYGIVLRDFPYAKLLKRKVKIKNYDINIFILQKPFKNFAYINGPSLYRSNILSLLKSYKDEDSTGIWFFRNGYRLAIVNNSGNIKKDGKISEHIFLHIGKNKTAQGMCNILMY